MPRKTCRVKISRDKGICDANAVITCSEQIIIIMQSKSCISKVKCCDAKQEGLMTWCPLTAWTYMAQEAHP